METLAIYAFCLFQVSAGFAIGCLFARKLRRDEASFHYCRGFAHGRKSERADAAETARFIGNAPKLQILSKN